MKANRLVEVF